MNTKSLQKTAILAVVIILSSIICWEIYLRNKGVAIAYDDGNNLWSYKRSQVYHPPLEATTFIGSSRIKFDLDIETWEKQTGNKAIQLAMEGQSPLPAFYNITNDEKFKGRLIIDVTEGLFFNYSPGSAGEINEAIAYYKDLTPSQKVSSRLNEFAESQFVFLDRDNFSLNALLKTLRIPNRPNVFEMPIFPFDFGRVNLGRQTCMTNKFIADTNLQNQVKGIWYGFSQGRKPPPLNQATLDSFLLTIKTSLDKLRSRGGQVLFVRTPSSGGVWMGEQQIFKRDLYWDHLLSITNTPGIHFKDYPAIANMICPEDSHLSPADAIVFTNEFIKILSNKFLWKFPNNL